MNSPSVPYSKIFDLGALGEQGVDIALKPSKDECASIAAWLGIPKIEGLTARVGLKRRGSDLYEYAASFEADVVQACVVTLEPVPAHLSGAFHRSFRVKAAARRRRAAPPEEPEIAYSGEDEPEILSDPAADLAAPVLEELSLALDPYPRAPGASFAAPKDKEPPAENPFAVLKGLKDKAKPKA